MTDLHDLDFLPLLILRQKLTVKLPPLYLIIMFQPLSETFTACPPSHKATDGHSGIVEWGLTLNLDFLNDNEIPNTGGEWFFLTPGISYNITNAIRISTKVEIPVYSYVEGIQLTPTYRFNAGINIRILKKRENEIFNDENKKV